MSHKHIGVTTLTFLGHVTSSVTWPFDSPGAISYRCSIVTESLSPAIFEIMGPIIRGHNRDPSRSRDVIGHVTNRSDICHFLLVSHSNRTSISNRFRDIRPPISVRAHTQTHAASNFIFCPMQCIALDRQKFCLVYQLPTQRMPGTWATKWTHACRKMVHV